jgi:hypothetical protein
MIDLKGKMTPHQYIQSLNKVANELTTNEIAQFILYMRDELYDNKLQCSPVTLSYLADISYRLTDSQNKKAWAVEMGKIGGAATTEAKQKASRENGKKGGRPKNI